MRPRDMSDATRAALASLGFLPDGLKGANPLAPPLGLAGDPRFIEEVAPEQLEQHARARAVAAAESTRGKEQSARLNQAKRRKAANRARLWVRRDKKLQEEFRRNRMESSDLAIRIRRLRRKYKRAPSEKSLRRYLK